MNPFMMASPTGFMPTDLFQDMPQTPSAAMPGAFMPWPTMSPTTTTAPMNWQAVYVPMQSMPQQQPQQQQYQPTLKYDADDASRNDTAHSSLNSLDSNQRAPKRSRR